jgi:hypothetical protein
MANDDLLGRKAAARYLQKKGCKTSPGTLASLAINDNEGKGPPFIRYRLNRRNYVSYRLEDLDAWAAKKLRRVE